MKKVIKYTFIGFVVGILLILIAALFISQDYSVARKQYVSAEKQRVQEYMANFENFDAWSPWSDADPTIDVVLKGEMGQVNSQYKWKGNDEAGTGMMTITSITDDTIKITVEFTEPFSAVSPSYYAFEETGEGTTVTWYMEGRMPYPMNFMTLFFSMEDAIGEDFEKGLQNVTTQFN